MRRAWPTKGCCTMEKKKIQPVTVSCFIKDGIEKDTFDILKNFYIFSIENLLVLCRIVCKITGERVGAL
jgi:hypothetical protein